MKEREIIDKFLASNSTCVLASVDGSGQPMAATVGFSHDEDFTLLIATNEKTQKYKNITANPKVAIVVGVEFPFTIQVEGTAELRTAEELGSRLDDHFKKVPAAKKLAGENGQCYFVITLHWLRFSDMSRGPEVFETRTFK